MTKTPEEILKQHAPGIILFGAGDGSVHKWNAVIKAMEEYAIQKLEQTVSSYEIDRVNLVAMTLERDELDEKYKEAVRDRKEYKKLYEEYKQRYDFAVLDGTDLRHKLEQLHEQYDRDTSMDEEKIYVTTSSPEDVYAAFIDKARAQWDAKESGTEVCSIKLHRGPKATFNDNEKDY